MISTNMRICLALVAGLLLTQATLAQQPLIVGTGPYAGVGMQQRYVSPWSGSMRWLMNPAVQQDLELIDEQIEKVNALRQEVQQEMQGFYKEYRELPASERQEKYYELNAELAKRVEKQIAEIILPEQQARLKQVDLQMRLKSHWALGHQLAQDELAEELGISKRQKEKLQKVQREVQQEYQTKMREIQERLAAEAQEKILGVLTPAQQKKLETMKGEAMEWPVYNANPVTEKKQ